eukprot:TRINITY_DN5300_c0_g1_i1.p1 TRINITY_DN5300_c0_g1~~TRINITY_DN5300_c0_g1_i1.p1  ORF type:complete len:326 (+),score=79.45 TRINITY_DN5300_c0_g1_i1:141-1118(+)
MRLSFPLSLVFLLSLCVCSSHSSVNVCDGDYEISTKAEVTTLELLLHGYNCTGIAGTLTVFDSNPGSILTLSGLDRFLQSASGVVVRDTQRLRSLDGLQGLSVVTGGDDPSNPVGVQITNNAALESLDGLSALTRVSKLSVEKNALLEDMVGLDNLVTVEGELKILSNDHLTSLIGLESLLSANVSDINDNPMLKCCSTDSFPFLPATQSAHNFINCPDLAHPHPNNCTDTHHVTVPTSFTKHEHTMTEIVFGMSSVIIAITIIVVIAFLAAVTWWKGRGRSAYFNAAGGKDQGDGVLYFPVGDDGVDTFEYDVYDDDDEDDDVL